MGIMRLFLILSFLVSLAYADTEREKIFSLVTSLPKVTTAKIQRGKTTIPVDFATPQAKSQIQDFDVIELSEGVYSNLGDFTAKYVRVRGQGPRKTIISNSGLSPILVNSTEFWDLSLTDAKFKLVDLNGLWAVNVEFAGAIQVIPAGPGKTPAFNVRSAYSDITFSDLPTMDDALHSNFVTKQGDSYLVPMPINKDLLEKRNTASFLAYEDQFDNSKDMNLKNRIGYKGLFARALNYFYQKEVLKVHYDQTKFNQLVKNARSTKAMGHIYVSMLYWAEADRLSGHSRFDEVLKEITPLTQSLGQECGCTVEGQGLASNAKSEIEEKLYAKVPVTALPGPCTIQTMQVNIPKGANKEKVLAAARQKNQMDQMLAYQNSERGEKEFLMGATALVSDKDSTTVADVEMKGVKKSYTNDQETSMDQNIIDPIAKLFKEKFAKTIRAAKIKIASSDLAIKLDGYITEALYGEKNPARQTAYEDLHEQQFGRKISSEGAMSSVFAY